MASQDAALLDRGLPFQFVGRPVRITIVAAATDTEVRHMLTVVPDGYIVLASRGLISRAPDAQWTPDLAYLRSSVATDEVLLVFVVLKEDALDVNP